MDDDVLDVYNAFLDGAPFPDVSVAERPDMPRSELTHMPMCGHPRDSR